MAGLIVPSSLRRRSLLDPARASNGAAGTVGAANRRLSACIPAKKAEGAASATKPPGGGYGKFHALAKKSMFANIVHKMGGGGGGGRGGTVPFSWLL